jgi:drug/metabolite transporter (DMT)-like permease
MWLFIRIGVQDVPPVTFAAARLAVALMFLFPLAVARRDEWPTDGREWALVATSGILLLGLNYALVYWGAQYVPSGVTALLQASTPAFGLVIGFVLGQERLTLIKCIALAVGLAGVALVSRGQLNMIGGPGALGAMAIAGGAVCVAVAYAAVKRWPRRLNPVVLITWQMVAALVPLAVLGAAIDGSPLGLRWTPRAVFALLYLAVMGSGVAFWLNYWLLRRMDASNVTATALVQPFLAMLLGAAILDERVTAETIVGGALILGGVSALLRRDDG